MSAIWISFSFFLFFNLLIIQDKVLSENTVSIQFQKAVKKRDNIQPNYLLIS